ncbi:MAG: L-histidine N(alpha)-methyltransferase [Calditrichia bacterium]
MSSGYRILEPKDLDGIEHANRQFALDVLIGLSEYPKRLSSKYFYDDEGSRLFQQIMNIPEYYLTNLEYEIFESHGEAIAQSMGNEPFNLVELGAGDGKKTNVLLKYFQQRKLKFDYVPIDISEGVMKDLVQSMRQQHPELKMNGLVAEYFEALKWISRFSEKRNLVLFLGSNLGNFPKMEARVFLRSLWNCLNDGDSVMIGFDLKKDIERMLSAYNDSKGVTAAFNLNLLTRINRELGGNFNRSKFRFYSSYNVFSGAIESYLVSLEAQTVTIKELGQSFTFKAWEPIHTEYSYKYLETDIQELAERTGYAIENQYYDTRKDFVDSVWKVVKQ